MSKKFQPMRFEQHIELPQVGLEGQRIFANSRILVVGCGGLGCPILFYLTAAGVGKIGLIDNDHVSVANLQRQILYQNQDVDLKKAEVAHKRLEALADHQEIISYPFFLEDDNAEEIISEYDVVIDATDNLTARFLINRVCLKLQKPWVYGAVFHFSGQLMVFDPREDHSPCFQCAFPNHSQDDRLPGCSSSGVLSPIPGMIGSLQAIEALKLLLPNMDSSTNSLFLYNFYDLSQNKISIGQDLNCKVCQKQREAA